MVTKSSREMQKDREKIISTTYLTPMEFHEKQRLVA